MKTEFMNTSHTELRPLNLWILPAIYIYSECKARPKYRTINFSWLWWTYIIILDEYKIK